MGVPKGYRIHRGLTQILLLQMLDRLVAMTRNGLTYGQYKTRPLASYDMQPMTL